MKTAEQLRKDIHQIKKSNRSQHSAIKQVLFNIIDILDHYELNYMVQLGAILASELIEPTPNPELSKIDMGESEEKPKNKMDDLASAILSKKGN